MSRGQSVYSNRVRSLSFGLPLNDDLILHDRYIYPFFLFYNSIEDYSKNDTDIKNMHVHSQVVFVTIRHIIIIIATFVGFGVAPHRILAVEVGPRAWRRRPAPRCHILGFLNRDVEASY